MGRAKRICHEKNICCFAWRLLQCNFKKVKIKQLEEWSNKYICWQLISTSFCLGLTSQVKTIQKKKNYWETILGKGVRDVVCSRCFEKFHKNHRKTTAPEPLFNKSAGQQHFFYKRLLHQLGQTFNGLWSSTNYLVKMYVFL